MRGRVFVRLRRLSVPAHYGKERCKRQDDQDSAAKAVDSLGLHGVASFPAGCHQSIQANRILVHSFAVCQVLYSAKLVQRFVLRRVSSWIAVRGPTCSPLPYICCRILNSALLEVLPCAVDATSAICGDVLVPSSHVDVQVLSVRALVRGAQKDRKSTRLNS